MSESEQMLFDMIIERLQQGGQNAAVSILKNWVKNETTKK